MMSKEDEHICFLCKHDLKTAKKLHWIGSNRLMICPKCLKNIDANKVIDLLITEKDIEDCKQKKNWIELVRDIKHVWVTIPSGSMPAEQIARYVAERM